MRPFGAVDGVSFDSGDATSSCSSFSFCFARSETDHVGEASGSPEIDCCLAVAVNLSSLLVLNSAFFQTLYV